MNEIENIVGVYRPSVYGISESSFKKDPDIVDIQIPGYELYVSRLAVYEHLAPSENRIFGPPPPGFWNDCYWSRGFWNDRSRLLIGRELAQLPLAGNYCHCFSSRTASDASTACSRLGTVHF